MIFLMGEVKFAKDNFFYAFLYTLCIALIPSTVYDMSYAFLKIADGQTNWSYISIFLIMAFIQIGLIFSMFYLVKTRSYKFAFFLGVYFTLTPLLLGFIFAMTDGVSIGYFFSYFLPMFHKISRDVYAALYGDEVVLHLNESLNFALTLLYGLSLLIAAKVFKRSTAST